MVAKKRIKFTFSENALDGEVLLEGGRVRVFFRFSPERVAFVKQLRGSRYDGDSKTWSFPREQYTEFNRSTLFPHDRYPRTFSEEMLAESVENAALSSAHALEAYRSNPFSVDQHHLRYLSVDIVFTLNAEAHQIRGRVKFGSRVLSIMTRMRGAHFLRSEGLFAVPAEKIAELLSKLRDKNFSFAVEATCSARLKSSSELRKRILIEPDRAAPQELEEACLTPFVDFGDGDAETLFAVHYATSRHLAILFPDDENFHARKRKSHALTQADLLTLLHKTQGLGYPLYVTRGVHSHLKRLGLSFDEAVTSGELVPSEEILPYLKTARAWVVFGAERAGLLLDESVAEKTSELDGISYEKLGAKRFYTGKDTDLVFVYKTLRPLVAAQETESFSKLIIDLSERAEDLRVNREARARVDADLSPQLFTERSLVDTLFSHQRVAVEWLSKREYSMLGDDMGLGKTLSVLATLDLWLTDQTITLAIIICPNSLTRNWLREANRFLPACSFLCLPESKADRGHLLNSIKSGRTKCSALVLNYERMRRPDVLQALLELMTERATLLCCDESQRVKNARSQTFLALRQLAPLATRRIALTGTPTPRDITDIWSQVQLLDLGKRFGTHYAKWLATVAELGTKYSDFAVRKFKSGGVERTIARVHELLLRRKKEEVLSLPDKTFVSRDCKMTGTQAARYKEVCDQLLLRIGTLTGGSFIKQIDNLMEEYLRGVQIASNPRLVDASWQGEPAKFLELDEIVDEVVRERGEKIVVWTNFLINIDELCERYKELGVRAYSGQVSTRERDITIEEFQRGDSVKILVAVPAAGGVGITLTAAQTAVYLDKSWNAEHWLQSVDRIHRIGQKGSVTIISLSGCKIDELISKNLARKGRAQAALLGDESSKAAAKTTIEEFRYPSREELLSALSESAEEFVAAANN